MKSFIFIFTFIFFANTQSSSQVTWNGRGNDNQWNNNDNWDTESVPQFGDDVIIADAQVEVTGNTAFCASLLIMDESTLTVNGEVQVQSSSLAIDHNIIVEDGSTLLVSQGSRVGITDSLIINEGCSLINEGFIEPATGSPFLRVVLIDDDTELFDNRGSIETNYMEMRIRAINDGILIVQEMFAPFSFTNNGTIYGALRLTGIGDFVNNSMIKGIINSNPAFTIASINLGPSAKFDNHGTIDFSNVEQTELIRVRGEFTNHDDAIINIEDFDNSIGIDIFYDAEFSNDGLLRCNDGNLFSSCIRTTSRDAVNEIGGMIASNRVYMTLDMQRQPNAFFEEFLGDSEFVNNGTISILNASGPGIRMLEDQPVPGGDLNHIFVNNNTLTIENPPPITGSGDNPFSYAITGSTQPDTNPFRVARNTVLNNVNGVINITSNPNALGSPSRGINAHTINHGEITITGNFEKVLEGILTNTGSIRSLPLLANDNITVFTPSAIELYSLNNTGFVNAKSLELFDYPPSVRQSPNLSSNSGTIDLDSVLTIHQGGTQVMEGFTNQSCGEIFAGGGITIGPDNVLDNEGLLAIDRSVSAMILENQLINTGVISMNMSDIGDNDIINNAMFVNDGLYIYQIEDAQVNNNIVTQVASGSNTANITVTSLTLHPEGNVVAGIYNIANNTITLNQNAVGVEILYAHFDMPNNCSVVAPIFFEDLDDCPDDIIRTWSGNFSAIWHNPSNWLEGSIPTSCNKVIIPNGSNCIIPSNTIGSCKLIEISSGASFEVNGELFTDSSSN